MGYGSIAGIPIVVRSPRTSRTRSVTILPNAHVIPIPPRSASEWTPMIPRRVRRHSEPETLLNWKILALLLICVSGTFIGVHLLLVDANYSKENYPFYLITRDFWYIGLPIESFGIPLLDGSLVSNVVLFHTRGEYCFDVSTCLNVISRMQNKNITDLPFNFLIGGDGKTYEVRGWNYVSGFHHLPLNETLAIGLIGNFTSIEPNENQSKEVIVLINESIKRKKLQKEYKVLGARLHEKDAKQMLNFLKTLENWVGWL